MDGVVAMRELSQDISNVANNNSAGPMQLNWSMQLNRIVNIELNIDARPHDAIVKTFIWIGLFFCVDVVIIVFREWKNREIERNRTRRKWAL